MYKRPHENSKSNTPYKRMLPSTMDRMKKLASEKGPVTTFEKEIGDVVGQQSAGSCLRNPLQVSNAWRQLSLTHGKAGGHLTEGMEMRKSDENKNNPFVQCVQAAPEPMCLLATNCQLDEMVRNCTDSSNYMPIGIDPTFKLNHFYVTPIVFPLKILVAKCTGSHLFT